MKALFAFDGDIKFPIDFTRTSLVANGAWPKYPQSLISFQTGYIKTVDHFIDLFVCCFTTHIAIEKSLYGDLNSFKKSLNLRQAFHCFDRLFIAWLCKCFIPDGRAEFIVKWHYKDEKKRLWVLCIAALCLQFNTFENDIIKRPYEETSLSLSGVCCCCELPLTTLLLLWRIIAW